MPMTTPMRRGVERSDGIANRRIDLVQGRQQQAVVAAIVPGECARQCRQRRIDLAHETRRAGTERLGADHAGLVAGDHRAKHLIAADAQRADDAEFVQIGALSIAGRGDGHVITQRRTFDVDGSVWLAAAPSRPPRRHA